MKSKKDKLEAAAMRQAEERLAQSQEPGKSPATAAAMGNLLDGMEEDGKTYKENRDQSASQSKAGTGQQRDESMSDAAHPHGKKEFDLDTQQEKRSPALQDKQIAKPEMQQEENMESAAEQSRPGKPIYNVNSDVRLEDYIEKGNSSSMLRLIPKTLLIILASLALVYGSYRCYTFLYAPHYKLAIANEYIDEAKLAELAGNSEIQVSASQPVYIRFQWEDTKLDTDYLRIQIYKLTGDSRKEEAVLGRKKPQSVNYIYFMGPLEVGKYSLEIVDHKGEVLQSKEFEVL